MCKCVVVDSWKLAITKNIENNLSAIDGLVYSSKRVCLHKLLGKVR